MTATFQETIVVESPARFAIIAPGVPAPRVVIASSEQVSDIVGFYSIREAGLDSVFSSDDEPRSSGILLPMLSGKESAIEPYLAYDLWLMDPEDGREKLYSLIISGPNLFREAIRSMEDISSKIKAQLERVVKAYSKSNRDELIYLGQMLATFVALLLARIEEEQSRIKRRRQAFTTLFTVYISIVGALLAAFGILSISKSTMFFSDISTSLTQRTK